MSDVNYQGITMTVPYQTFETMKRQIDELTTKNQELKKRPLSPNDPGDEADTLRAALSASLPIIQFAVSNLPPEAIRGWPHQKLAEFGRHLAQLVDDPRLLEMATTFRFQAEHQAEVDAFRAKRVADADGLFTQLQDIADGKDDSSEDVDTRPG